MAFFFNWQKLRDFNMLRTPIVRGISSAVSLSHVLDPDLEIVLLAHSKKETNIKLLYAPLQYTSYVLVVYSYLWLWMPHPVPMYFVIKVTRQSWHVTYHAMAVKVFLEVDLKFYISSKFTWWTWVFFCLFCGFKSLWYIFQGRPLSLWENTSKFTTCFCNDYHKLQE